MYYPILFSAHKLGLDDQTPWTRNQPRHGWAEALILKSEGLENRWNRCQTLKSVQNLFQISDLTY